MNNIKIMNLPEDVKMDIMSTLKCFNEVHVIFENGLYNVQTGVMIKGSYSKDYKFIDTIKKEDIYTEDEMIQNYIESFHSFPTNYRGERNYSILKEMDKIGWNAKVKLTMGGIEIIK